MQSFLLLFFLTQLSCSYLNFSLAQDLANNALSYYLEMASSDYMVHVQIKQNFLNDSINLYDVRVQRARRSTLLLANIIGYVDMEVFINSTTQNINVCIATETQVITYDEDLSEIQALIVDPNLQLFRIKYYPLYDLMLYQAHNITQNKFETGQISQNGNFTVKYYMPKPTFHLWVKDQAMYHFRIEIPGQVQSVITIIQLPSTSMIVLPESYSFLNLSIPLFINQQFPYSIGLEVFYSPDNQTLFLSTHSQITYYNHSSKTVINTVTFPNISIIAIAECAAELFTITESSGVFDLLRLSIPDLTLIESVSLPTFVHFQLICSNDQLFIFPVGSNLIYQAELVLSNTLNQTFDHLISYPDLQPKSETPQFSEEVQNAIEYIKGSEIQEHLKRAASSVSIVRQMGGKNFLKFFNSIIDLFFPYKFHGRNYTEFLFFFSQEMDILVQLKIKPNFLEEANLDKVYSFKNRDYLFKEQVEHQGNFQPSIYFLQQSKDFFLVNVPITIIIFSLLYIGRILLFRLKIENYIVQMIYFQLFLATKWWMLITSILEDNLAVNCFYLFLQTKAAFSLIFWDKVNFSLALLLNLIYLIYTVAFYSLLYAQQRRKVTKEIVSETKFHFKGFFLISLLGTLNNFVRSALHAYFFQNGLIGLLLQSVGMIVLCIALRKMFRNRFIFLLIIGYYGVAVVFDLHLYLLSLEVEGLDYEIWSFVLILLMIGLSFLRNLTVLVFDIKEFICQFCHRNRIQDISPQEQKQQGTTVVEEINHDFIPEQEQNDHFLNKYRKNQDFSSTKKQKKMEQMKKQKKMEQMKKEKKEKKERQKSQKRDRNQKREKHKYQSSKNTEDKPLTSFQKQPVTVKVVFYKQKSEIARSQKTVN